MVDIQPDADPLADRVVLEVIDDQEQTTGGIFIPDTAREKPQQGRVVAVGPGKRLENGQLEPMNVSEGQVVLFQKYAGTDIKFGDTEFKILAERDILGVIEG